MNKLALGTSLTLSDQQHVLGGYCHRFTGDHMPKWVGETFKNDIHFKDDADWLAHTRFHVRKNGRLDHRFNSCESNPTWPNNPELRQHNYMFDQNSQTI